MPIGVRYQRNGGYGRLFEWGSYLATSQFPFGYSVLGEGGTNARRELNLDREKAGTLAMVFLLFGKELSLHSYFFQKFSVFVRRQGSSASRNRQGKGFMI